MKKFFAIAILASVMVACNNSSENKPATDTPAAPAVDTPAAPAVDTAAKVADTAAPAAADTAAKK
ncbi:MAG: hypothetical protein IAE96_11555 [Chitinophagaceae bacterium]|nr:hypothetical protein [Chitinophagaceae bacterium]